MRLEDIFTEWEADSPIDRLNLSDAALNNYKLHAKYHKIYTYERILLRKYEQDLKVLRLEKWEFYTQGPTEETQKKGWKLPPIGKIIKADCGNYVDADADVVSLTLKIGVQQEKVTLLKSIIDNIQYRGNTIKTALDAVKFEAGF